MVFSGGGSMEPPLCTNGSAGYLMQLSVNLFGDNQYHLFCLFVFFLSWASLLFQSINRWLNINDFYKAEEEQKHTPLGKNLDFRLYEKKRKNITINVMISLSPYLALVTYFLAELFHNVQSLVTFISLVNNCHTSMLASQIKIVRMWLSINRQWKERKQDNQHSVYILFSLFSC